MLGDITKLCGIYSGTPLHVFKDTPEIRTLSMVPAR